MSAVIRSWPERRASYPEQTRHTVVDAETVLTVRYVFAGTERVEVQVLGHGEPWPDYDALPSVRIISISPISARALDAMSVQQRSRKMPEWSALAAWRARQAVANFQAYNLGHLDALQTEDQPEAAHAASEIDDDPPAHSPPATVWALVALVAFWAAVVWVMWR